MDEDVPPAKRGVNEINDNDTNKNNRSDQARIQLYGKELQEEVCALSIADPIGSVELDNHTSVGETITVLETPSEIETIKTIETDEVVDDEALAHATNITTSSLGLVVTAPEFQVLHDSWETFDKALKVYGKMTYQLYVIRSTTSVRRRNCKIIESRARGDNASNVEALKKVELELEASMDQDVDVVGRVVERTLIPERFLWYSKSLKCTHGWKDRHRGTGKRGSGVVRSTSCPAKMCVTLQHRGPGPDDWKVVVTKHVRTHNHQLSKELYLYYTENRRIYDPDLLAVAKETCGAAKPSVDMANAHLVSLIEQANQRTGLHHILPSNNEQIQRQATSMALPASSSPSSLSSCPNESGNDDRTSKNLMTLTETDRGNEVARPRVITGISFATMPPLGAMVLTPGTIRSKAIGGGGFCVPRVSVKVHASWDAFHDFIAQYSFDTMQVFRTRSTVSIAARNAKIVASVAAKCGQDGHDVASYASYAATSPSSRLIPEKYKWFSKLLICTYGRNRRVRGGGARVGEQNDEGPCPAMLLARMERNVDGDWYVVINRQVQKHNHRLHGYVEEACGSNQVLVESGNDTTGALATASNMDSNSMRYCSSVHSSTMIETETSETSVVKDTPTQSFDHREIVVRVPKIQSVFNSWDDFHASLKAYSDATYQLYRTRTTSSAKGRNKKIAQMERGGGEGETDKNSEARSEQEVLSSGANVARKIPEPWRWYSKTLTCTHGWKERHRGAGKRSAHGVRSTACPVKICATVQYINQLSRLDGSDSAKGSCAIVHDSCWRVVVTKHIVDHNHNLSRELYQHYCENRRIYNPELLAIGTSNNGFLVKRKVNRSPSDHGASASDTSKHCIVPAGHQITSQSLALSTELEAGLAEIANHGPLFGSSGSIHALEVDGATTLQQTMTKMPTSACVGQQFVPSVVLAPYNSTISCQPARTQSQDQQQQEQREDQQQQPLAACGVSSNSVYLSRSHVSGESAVALATPAINSSNLVVLNDAGAAMSGGLPRLGSNVISVACRVHGSSAGVDLTINEKGIINPETITSEAHEIGSANTLAAQCTCFRIAGGGTYVTIVPASGSSAPTETNFDVEDEAMLCDEDMDGGWQPSSHVEIEKVTLENGETVWLVPRIVRRYSSWEEFHTYLDAYSAATFQLYRVRTTYSVRSRNVRLRQLAASRGLLVREGDKDNTRDPAESEQEGVHGLSRAHLVPERYEWYSKTFLCTHGWKRRSRGSGQRVSHNVRAAECPAKVCATLQRTDGSSKWNVVVTKHLAEHNHELSEAIYLQYSEVRRVRNPEVLAQAEQLWRGGATRRHVFEYLKERSPNQIILMKDVHNLVQRWQSRERRPRQDQQQDSIEDQPVQLQSKSNASLDVSASHDDENAPWL
ncbi:unnamed protein product [Peronospora belbahrii]|uniref:FAR1 domain-containing protein n=1 Tax=Peronospora belbahrii TaxID=622444 RepID=A0AAU9KZW8_9STRA|nr:unnamed protein product [Peronospora belbahrii]